jgi:indoleamine 2,3-dioxygenase
MDFSSYDDGFFAINEKNGFLPKADPFPTLPSPFEALQEIITHLSEYIRSQEVLEAKVANLPNYLPEVQQVDPKNVFLFQALYRDYAMLTSAYLLQPAHLNQKKGIYGKAKQHLPANITQPFEFVSDIMQVFPFLDYHYAYSLGNYVKRDPSLPLERSYEYTNLKLAASFSGASDEEGFIMLHVDIVAKTPKLIEGIKVYTNASSPDRKLEGLQLVLEASKEVNTRRKLMWQASNHRNYNDFRAFIMGIKGNEEIFGEGVYYEGSLMHPSDVPRAYRGQTGAQDDTIPTLDIFTGVIKHYPDNELTRYLLDLRQYRPVVFQTFFRDLEKHTIDYLNIPSQACLKTLYLILVEIYNFRNGHWQFVQKYILENTRYAKATGGTPITTWLPNQIGAVLKYMQDVLFEVEDGEFYTIEAEKLTRRIAILKKQQAELRYTDYNLEKVVEAGRDFNEFSHNYSNSCSFSGSMDAYEAGSAVTEIKAAEPVKNSCPFHHG